MRRAWVLGIVLAHGAFGWRCAAQGIRAVTRPVVMTPSSGILVQSVLLTARPASTVAPSVAPLPALATRAVGPPVASKEDVARNTLAFQKRRAEAGAAFAQFDLGVRYLKGDGVGKDLAAAKKWLSAAAKNGNSQAARKLQEMKQETESPAE